MYFWHADKHQVRLQGDTIILGVCNQACLKYPKQVYISPEKYEGDVDFLPADKHKSFQQDDCITLGVHSQACPNHPKKQVCYLLQYRKKDVSEEDDFLHAISMKVFYKLISSIDDQAFRKFP